MEYLDLADSDGGKITTGDTTLSYSGISKKNAEYFVIVGKPTEIMKGLSEVSGSAPMYPKWAMGFTNTQWGWPGSDEGQTSKDIYLPAGKWIDYSNGKEYDGITFKTAKKEGTYDSDLETYTVKLHVKNATSVTCNGKELKKSGTLAGIDTASAGTYSVGADDLGEAVYIKIDAGDVTTLDVKCDVPTAAQQSATVYAKTSAGSADLEYSTDGGNTWTNKESMTQSSNAGYLQADIKYIPEGGNNVKVRCNLGDNNYFKYKRWNLQ